jgi:uncharacterized protein with PIN domain
MLNTNKCPKCDRMLTSVTTEDITMNVGFSPKWKGFSHACPSCHAVLGVELNPLAVREDILNEVAKMLGRTRP